jgi:hypothetical protein
VLLATALAAQHRLALAEEVQAAAPQTGLGPAGSATGDEPGLPAAAARRQLLAEPFGSLPAPWASLSAVLEGGAELDGRAGSTALRVHVPVASRYGAVDARLLLSFDGEGLEAVEPELLLRAIPARLAGGRGALGLSAGLSPRMDGPDPLMVLGGGLMGGYLARLWMVRGYLGARGEILRRSTPVAFEAEVALGLRLAYGLQPQVEACLVVDMEQELSVVLRPGLRYWPRDWVGIGLSGDLWVAGERAPAGALRLDLVFQALE